MKRLLATILLLATGGGTALRLTRDPPAATVPSFTVARTSFIKRVTADGVLRAVTATPVIIPEMPGYNLSLKVAWLAPDGIAVQKRDVIMRFDPNDATKQLREAEAELEKSSTLLRREELTSAAKLADHAASTALKREITALRVRFQSTDPLVFSRNQIKESELATQLAVATQDQAEHSTQSERAMARSRIALATLRRDSSQIAVGQAKEVLDRMQVRAPSDGILVLRRNDHGDIPKLGDSMSSGSTIADLPIVDTMETELFILEVDGSGLAVDQPAEIVVESRPELTFHGKVRQIDALAKPRLARSPAQYFSVVVALDHTDRDAMKPGQRVRGTLLLDSEQALVVPRQAVFEREGGSFVYRRELQGYTPVPVGLGAATAGLVIVKSGLAPGDVIAERDPTQETP